MDDGGDNGSGNGAKHQRSWTGVVKSSLAPMHFFATETAEQVLDLGEVAAVFEVKKPPQTPKNQNR